MITRANLNTGDERVMGCEAVNLRSLVTLEDDF
jgi:hypothetical protein